MKKRLVFRLLLLGLLMCAAFGRSPMVRIEAMPREKALAPVSGQVAVDADDIGGVVTSSHGAEAGVWVIAETKDFQTKLRKIVVTDDQGRFLLPEFPKASYKVWVRGYGLGGFGSGGRGTRQDFGASRGDRPQSCCRRSILSAELLAIPVEDPSEGRFSHAGSGRQ